jgi:hypothetical protein
MRALREFLRNQSGVSAAEFALVLPLALLLLFGIIDVGNYVWNINQMEKAVQMGARYAVSTQIVPSGLNSYDPIGFSCPSGVIAIGDPVCKEALGTISCSSSGGSPACSCTQSPCPDLGTPNADAFANIVARMRAIMPSLKASNITIKYSGSGLGYAGDPATDEDGNALSDIAPVVNVEINDMRMRAMMLLGGGIALPGTSASLTLEDGDGAIAY